MFRVWRSNILLVFENNGSVIMHPFFEQVKGKLIVSCQALADEPLHSAFIMGRMALAAKEGGAAAIRAQGTDDIKEIKKVTGLPNIDCRYNYINHFDVFADLVGIYKSSVYYAEKGSSEVAGEITAVWNDRYVKTEEGIMRQNNVYANVLASTERAWKGGGKQYIENGGTTLPNVGDEYDEFADWERRFLFHKAHSLKDENIPYVRQTNVRWLITDAFPNGGTASKVLPPETEGLKDSYVYDGHTYRTKRATGAGIYLRHTWGTTVPAFYKNPQLNYTAYAWTYVYSPVEQEAGALIEFQNYGRSEKDSAPVNGSWDRKGSHIWLNDVQVRALTTKYLLATRTLRHVSQ